ncbi:hypothetical protein Tco_0642860 [Tanacetum coccineum]
MSGSEHSTVTYTSISSDYEEPIDVGSPRVVVYGYDGLPMHPPSPDYVPDPEHPPSPVYPDFMPPEDDVIPTDEQPLPTAVSPTADSPSYITESDPEEDLEEEDDKDPKEDPTDYPTKRYDDEEEEESSGDDADDVEDDESEDKEEEHLAPADSVPPPVYRTTARMFIRTQTPIPFLSEAEVDRLLAIPSPPPSPLTSYSSPLPQISPPPLPASPTHPLGYKAAMIRLRAESPSNSHPLSLPPPIVLPHTRASMAIMRAAAPADVPEVTFPPRKRLCIAPGPRYEIEECLSAPTARPTEGFRVDYDTWDEMVEAMQEIAPTTLEGVNQRVTDLVTTIKQDTDEVYKRLDDAQDDRSLMSGQLNLLRRDRRSHARTARLMENKAKASPQQTEIGDLQAADRRRQAQLLEALTLLGTLQTQMVALQSQQRPARDPAHPDVPEEAGSSS